MRKLLCLSLVCLGLGGCNAALVGGTVLVLGAGAAISYECPGYVALSLRDELTGAELCGETVLARSGDRERRLTSCATMSLPDGRWELRAERGGAPTTVDIERPKGCERWVYDVELTLPPPVVTASSG